MTQWNMIQHDEAHHDVIRHNTAQRKLAQRRIVKKYYPYEVHEVTEHDGLIHWEIISPVGFLGDYLSLYEARARVNELLAFFEP